MVKKYNKILQKAKNITTNVKNNYKLGETTKWSYYIAKSILNGKKDVKEYNFDKAPNPKGTHISRQLTKSNYWDLAKQLIKFVEHHKRLPNYLVIDNTKIRPRLYTLMFSKILISYEKNNTLPSTVNVNSKAFTKPTETTNEVYNYFIKVFGKFDNTIDGALSKVKETGYGGYNNDKLSNKETIDGMKSNNPKKKPNCTDSCHVFYNIMLQLIELKKYKKVECLHVQCSEGGHVKLRITRNDGTTFIRDPACVISKNGKPINCVWCTNTPKAINPNWFKQNLHR